MINEGIFFTQRRDCTIEPEQHLFTPALIEVQVEENLNNIFLSKIWLDFDSVLINIYSPYHHIMKAWGVLKSTCMCMGTILYPP